jgi:hypothetical protein
MSTAAAIVKQPCSKDCPDRKVIVDGDNVTTCHSTCERYLKYLEDKEKARVEINKMFETNSAIIAHKKEVCAKAARARRKP